MSGNWDDEDNFVPPKVDDAAAATEENDDRWAGEDEDRVKDNWDDEEEDHHKLVSTSTSTVIPPKKTIKQRIAEKEAKKAEELKAKRLEIQRMNEDMTPEEKVAEKIRIQKAQEESDLQFAVDMMGITKADSTAEVKSLDDIDLNTEEGLQALGTAVIKKIRETDRLEKKAYYVTFMETFSKDLCSNLEVDELKKVTATLNALYNEKVKASRPTKGKKKTAGKAKLNLGKETGVDVQDDRYIDDCDDFI